MLGDLLRLSVALEWAVSKTTHYPVFSLRSLSVLVYLLCDYVVMEEAL